MDFKVNQNKAETLAAMKKILLLDEMLFRFDVSCDGSATVLTIEKESEIFEYSVFGENQYKQMKTLLEELQSELPMHLQNDVDLVIGELLEQKLGIE